MQIHELKAKYKNRGKKRIGRGGKRGTTAGRGQKGQKSRAGRKMRPGLSEFIIRLPKKRGIKNKSLKEKSIAVNVGELERYMEKGSVVNQESLRGAGLIRRPGRVKILGGGELKKSLTIEKGVSVSDSARKKIESAGGTLQ